MTPLVVTAHLRSAARCAHPLLLDGILFGALGARMGLDAPGGWADPADVVAAVEAGKLPLDRVTTPAGWWYAASSAAPAGPEETIYVHRRFSQLIWEGYSAGGSVNVSTGPDKNLRTMKQIRPYWRAIRWYCYGNPEEIRDLLWRIGGVGDDVGHGAGAVDLWTLSTGHWCSPHGERGCGEPTGEAVPPVQDFEGDLLLRHMPVAQLRTVPLLPGLSIRRHRLPLRPPYHLGHDRDAGRLVDCWQVRSVTL